MKTTPIFTVLLFLVACGGTSNVSTQQAGDQKPIADTSNQTQNGNTITGHLGLLFDDGTYVPYPTSVEIYYGNSTCIAHEGNLYVLHIALINTSEVAGTFTLKINDTVHGPFSIGASSIVGIDETVPYASTYTITVHSDQTSARGRPDQQTGKEIVNQNGC
jgi:hypothetical protein